MAFRFDFADTLHILEVQQVNNFVYEVMLRNFSDQVLLTLRNARVFWTIAFGGLFFAFAGPFGSFSEASVVYRIIFWTPAFLLAFVAFAIAHAVVLHGFQIKNLIAFRIVSYLMFTAFFTPLLYAFFLFGQSRMEGGDPSFMILLSWVALTAGTSTAIYGLMNPEPVIPNTVPQPQKPDAPIPPRLLRRLGRDANEVSITRLTVNDHYVHVGLCDGSEQRLLMRLSDAIAEMDDVQGFTTHRSHWVSRKHIKGLRQEGRREMLELSTGTQVPISRTYRPVLLAAGVIPQASELPETLSEPQSAETQKGN